MKTGTYLYLAIALFFFQCTRNQQAPTPQPVTVPAMSTINYDQESIKLMADLAPKIVGQWTLRLVQIKRQSYNKRQEELNITKDSTLLDFATLIIKPASVPRSSPKDLRRGEYDGTIQYAGKTYPISFDMLANSNWIVNKKGPQTYFMFGYHFPNGTRIPEKEEKILDYIGVVGDNFTLEIGSSPNQMIWRGLNRGVERIELVKR